MQTGHRKDIRKILRAALEIEPEQRSAFLKTNAPTAEIRSKVESLLACEAESEDFMSLPISDFSRDFLPSDAGLKNSLIGQKIGNYEITGELGFGGMGAVYLAERADGKFKQKAALKMLRREFNVEKIRRNFEREKEILAKLNHPFIARLLDAGTTADGVPYLVMEYVEGVPFDEFCASGNLPLKKRLKLFNKVCEAVAVAHQNLIIHRDLKPSNILITEKGEPKLLDFGISKLLDAETEAEKTSVTILGAMTPEYASPEQISGGQITTATDIYSLGVVLFKILTGAFPYDFKNKTNGELFKIITEDEPTALSAISNFKLQISDKENPKSEIRNPKLNGDLDNIIFKAIAKEPMRRYQTVEQFAADIWRFVDDKPILARPATAAYRTRKYFQRNKLAVIAAGLIFLSLIGGIAVALWQAREARAQANFAFEAQKKSDEEKEKAEKISRFMFKVFGYANPAWYAEGYKTGGNARVIDALEDLRDKIEIEFTGQADVQAELHHRFAEVFGRVASYHTEPARKEEMFEKSKFHTCRALELRRQFYGDRHELVAKDLYFGQHCVGKTTAEFAATLDKAINMMRGTNPNNLNLPYMLSEYANRLALPEKTAVHDIYFAAVTPPTAENKYEIAEKYYREALPVFRLHYEQDNLAIFQVECNLTYVLAIQEKWSDFDAHYAVCKQGEPQLKEFYAKFGNAIPPFDLIEKTLAEKGIVR